MQKDDLDRMLRNLNIHVHIAACLQCDKNWHSDGYDAEFSSIGLVRSGESYITIDDQIIYPKAGMMYMLPQGSHQTYGAVSTNYPHKYYTLFHISANRVSLFDMLKMPLMAPAIDFDRAQEVFERLIRAVRGQQLGDAALAKGLALELVSLYLQSAQKAGSITLINQSSDRILQSIAYIDSHLAGDLSIVVLAARAGYHPNYYIRLFKKETGVTPLHYINYNRMQKACQMLMAGDMPIAAIAQQMGYANQFYFTSSFKRLYGISPSHYRKYFSIERRK